MQPTVPTTTSAPSRADKITVSNEEIAGVAQKILESTGEPILLSNLGSRLSKHYGRALREILASRKLKRILELELPGRIDFSGELSKVTVKLLSDEDKLNAGTYDATVWAAFFKPVKNNHIGRAIKLSQRFDFHDVADTGDVPPGWHFIAADLVPDGKLPKADREAKAKVVIHDWCVQEGVDRNSLLITSSMRESHDHGPSLSIKQGSALASHQGAASLIAFIESIPVDKRKSYSLTLDLIYQLIG